jgi:dihydrofolate synthase/folylpolyglutamate synthase
VSARASLLGLEFIGIKLGLEQISGLLDLLDRPERAFPSLVIAGTNGKGSVTALVERGLRAAGLRTGRYTSPHLVHLEERFAIDGVSIAPGELDRVAAVVMQAAHRMDAPPSFFEATTALALEAFRDARVDVAVLEVGLGGRLDATNAVASRAVAITAVDLDHQAYLGDTIEAIAAEKAGVIKPGGLAILGENPPEVRRVVADIASTRGATLVYAPEGVSAGMVLEEGRMRGSLRTPRQEYADLTVGLRGRHQLQNAVTAVRLLEELTAADVFPVSAAHIRTAVEDVTWPGRLEVVAWGDGSVVIDGAHNPSGAAALAAYVRDAYGRAVPFVIGVMRDKHAEAMVAALAPVASHFVCTAAASARAMPADALADLASRVAPRVPVLWAASAPAALERARPLGSTVVVAGSLYLAGEVRAELS